MAEIELQSAGVVALVGDFVAAGVPQHVRMDRQAEAALAAGAPQQLAETAGGHWRAAFGDPDVSGRLLLALEAAQRPELAVIDDIFSFGRLSTGAVEEVEWAASAGCNADGAGKIAS